MKAADVRSRIYVGHGHLKQDIPEQALQQVERFLQRCPDAFALLEFTSPGPDRRQIDCALVSAGGIDVIEVKRHGGLIDGTVDGPWRARRTGRIFSNTKKGESENPYQQAERSAADFQAWLDREYGTRVRVTPAVFMPNADRGSAVRGSDHVRLALGNTTSAFTQALRSAFRNHGGGWNGAPFQDLPARLGLQPMHLAFVQGRVVNALEHAPLADLNVWIEAGSERFQATTNPGGYYEFAVLMNSEVRLGVVTPDRYQATEPVVFTAQQAFQTVEDVILPERYGQANEADLREQLHRSLQAELDHRVRQTQAALNDTQLQMGLLIDDLQGQLRAALAQLTAREQEVRAAPGAADLPLPVLVARASELNVLQAQRGDVTQALQSLAAANNHDQQEAVRGGIDALIRVATARQSLPAPQDAPLPVRVSHVTPRLLAPLPPDDAPFPDGDLPVVQHERRPTPTPIPTPTPAAPPVPAVTVTTPAPPPARHTRPPRPWLWVAGAAALVSTGLLLGTLLRPAPTVTESTAPTTPAAAPTTTPAPAPDPAPDPTMTAPAPATAAEPGVSDAPLPTTSDATTPTSAAPVAATAPVAAQETTTPTPEPAAAPPTAPVTTPKPATPPAARPATASTTRPAAQTTQAPPAQAAPPTRPATPRPAQTPAPTTPVRTDAASPTAPVTPAITPTDAPAVTSDPAALPGVPVTESDTPTNDFNNLPGTPVN
ncbi:NERD domain-containing protein [Deinococcus sp. RM]|uniref:NERD domain-containing protein n=1 Tax=Deinococcus sp. RM TaxID=2316359 RepID=UPI00131423B6|nr:NERD domain-containing protein [Deinococcus sp. RM]